MREMKDSGNSFIGKIPKDWVITPLKFTIKYNVSSLPESTSPEYEFDYVDIGSVTYGKGIEQYLRIEFKDAPSRARRIVEKGDVILSTVRTYLKAVAAIPEHDYPIVVSTGFVALRALNKIIPDYLKYAVQSDPFVSEIEANSYGVSYPAINASDAVKTSIVLPSLIEQGAIAELLDAKCAKIDALSADIQSEIDTLESYKRSVITEAVTRGLDKNVPMKDSGTPWCPLIPAHWIRTNPKALFSQRFDRAYLGERQLTASQEHGIVYQDEFMEMTGSRVVTVIKDFSILKHVEPGDFVISMRSFQGGLEYSELRGCISSAYVMLIPNKELVYPPFFRWFFKSSKYINAIQSTSNLVRDGQAMRFANFVQVPLFIIPKEEQKQIADYLNDHISEVNTIIQAKQEQLSVLANYKKSIIFEYVTGKRKI